MQRYINLNKGKGFNKYLSLILSLCLVLNMFGGVATYATDANEPVVEDATAPAIKVEGLSDEQTVTEKQLQFRVTVTDEVYKNIVPVVTLNDVEIASVEFKETDEKYNVNVELDEGENIIGIEATDEVGNKAKEKYTITYSVDTLFEFDSLIEESLIKLRDYYKNQSIDYIPAMAYSHYSNDLGTIYENLRTYNSTTNVYNCYKGIMGAIASGKDPRSFQVNGNKLDYVAELENLQKEDGYFNTAPEIQAYCILALDMASGEYDIDGAIQILKDKLIVDDDIASVNNDLKKTAIVMTALSNHTKIDGVQELINKGINYIKSKQNEEAGFFKDEPEILGPVIQALIAVGENPLQGGYIKNEKTMLDVLMGYQNSDGTFNKGPWYKTYDKASTEAAFAALADLNKNSSMYHDLKVEIGDIPANIILEASESKIIIGKTLRTDAKVVDKEGRLVPRQSIVWTSSNEEVATVEDGLITAKTVGFTTIEAKLENDPSVSAKLEIEVISREPAEIKLYIEEKEVISDISIKKDESVVLSSKVFDKDGDEIEHSKITWEIINGSEYISLENGTIKALNKGKASIRAYLGEVEKHLSVEVIPFKDIAKMTLNEVKTYIDGLSSIDYLTALSLSHIGEDKSKFSEKISVSSYSSNPKDCAKNIISIIAAGKDPRNYEGKNYVKELIDSQDDSGYFKIGYSYTDEGNIILPIIALDMAGAKYDVENALNKLKLKAKSSGSTKAFEGNSDINTVEMTSLGIIAMSNHRDDSDINDLIEKTKAYLKLKQNDKGVFEANKTYGYGTEESCRATASVIQALIALGENPLGEEWLKNDNTIYDGLMTFKDGNKFKKTSTSSYSDKDATIRAFAALSDLTKDKSMYHESKIEVGEVPATIEIISTQDFVKEKQELILAAKVLDDNGKLVPEQAIEWSISDNSIASINENGVITAKELDEDKEVVITAKVVGKDIQTTKNIRIKARIPYKVEIKLPENKEDHNLKEGRQLILFDKVFEEDGEEIKYEDVVWTSSNEDIATVDNTGKVTAKNVEKDIKVTITASSASKPEVKASIELKILAIIPNKIKLYIEDEEIEELTIESGFKIKLIAKAYESDGEEIESPEFEWLSGDENIVTVDENGVVLAKEVIEEQTTNIKVKITKFETEKSIKLTVIPPQTLQQRTQIVIDELKNYYKDKSKYNYLEALAANRVEIDKTIIKDKLDIKEPNFDTGWSGSKSEDYAKAIMGLIAAGQEPREYNEMDLVSYLANAQTEEGYFYPSEYSYHESDEKQADYIANSIIALDMAGADYNSFNAVKALEDNFYIDGDSAYVVYSSYSNKPHLERTAISLIALSNHESEEGVAQLLEKGKNYLKQQASEWDEKTESKTISYTIQALVALGEDITEDNWLQKDKYDNSVSIIKLLLPYKSGNEFKNLTSSSYTDDEATVLAFIANIDANKSNSTYEEVKIEVGEPVKIEISLENHKKEVKVGKSLQLKAKAYDYKENFVPKQEFVWNSDNPSVVEIDQKTGLVNGIVPGIANITAQIKDSDIKETIAIHVIPVVPNKIEVSIDDNISEIKVGEKVKINAIVYDVDDETIENSKIEWVVSPEECAEIGEGRILTALGEGQVTITGKVSKGSEGYISSDAKLDIVIGKSHEDKIKETIDEVKEYFKTEDSYDFVTSLGLRHAGVEVSEIVKNINIYGSSNLHNDARNIMNLIASGENPRDYKEKDYVSQIDKEFYKNEDDVEYIAKAIVALDMSGAEDNKEEAITALIGKLEKNDNKYYAKSYSSPDNSATAWTLIALSNYQDVEGVKPIVDGIKTYFKSVQGHNGLIENCEDTSLVVQGIMALGEEPLSDEWAQYDKYGNKITLLDGILACKKDNRFKLNPESSYPGHSTTQHALAALADLYNGKSMYHQLKYVVTGPPEKVNIKLEKQEILIGEELQIEANVYDKDDNLIKDAELIWTSSDSTVLKVENGIAIGLKAGKAKIKVELKNNNELFIETNIVVEEAQDISLRVKAALNKLIDFYEKHNSFDYMATLSVEHIKSDFNVEKLQVKENLRLYRKDFAIHYAKNIMEIVGAGENPKYYPLKDNDGNVEYKNYVKLLVDSQRENGEFIVNETGYKDSIVNQSLSIMALDMIDARYDKRQGINRLLEMLGDSKYEKDGLYTEVETRALAITALSKHKDIAGVQTAIDKALEYIKLKQNESGGFDHAGYKNNPFAIGTVMQALIANDIEPATWVKNGHTMIEVLLERQIADGGFEYGDNTGNPEDEIFSEFKSTETAFAALSDFCKGQSMYHALGIDEELKEKLKDEIEFLKEHYVYKKQFEFVAAPAANLAGMDINLLQNNIFRYTKTNSAWQASKTIISLIGSNLDPRYDVISEDEIRNYVHELKSSQVMDGQNKGEFILTTSEIGDRNSIEALAMSIMALDMAGAKYDEVSAINRLVEMVHAKDSHTYTEIHTEALVLTALAKHKDIDGVKEEVNRLLDFFKEKQNEDGGFDIKEGWKQGKNSPLAIGRIIQALIANDINPLYSEEWIKNGNTMVDALLKSKIIRPDKPELSGYSKGEDDEFAYYGSTYTVFAALVDLYNNESMFEILAVDYSEEGEPTRIEITKPENPIIYLGKSIQLKATIYDKDDKVLENAEVEWTSSNEQIATVENGFVSTNDIGQVDIIAKIKGTEIQSQVTISVTDSNISRIEIEPKVEKLNLGEKIKLIAKVIDDRGDIVEGKEVKWTSSDKNIATVDVKTGEVTAIAEGKVEIKITLEEDEKIFGSIDIEIVKEIEETCDIYTAIVVDKGKEYERKSEPKQITINTKEHKAGLTALGALQATTDKYVLKGSMVTEIFGIQNEGMGGWMYTINDKVPEVYSDKAVVKEGDKVVWFYIADGNEYKVPKWSELTGQEPEEKLTINIISHKTSIKVDEELPLAAEVRKGDTILTDREIMWLSSNAEIATIEDGKLIARKAGQVTITASLVEDKDIKATIKINVIEKDLILEEVIGALRKYYSNKDEFTFRQALGYNYTSDNLEKDLLEISSKFKTNEKPTSASEHVGNIMGLVAGGKDPYSHNNKDYVKALVEAQNTEGKFIIGEYDDYSTTQAFSILALDMGDAKYNRDKAIAALLGYQKAEGSFGGVDETGMVLTALAKYRDDSKVKVAIEKGLSYLKGEQDSNTGGFITWGSESPHSASAVLQGLIAVGEDPLSEEWTKDGKTIVDSLMNFYKDGHFEKESEWTPEPDIDSITEQAFIALADVYKGQSMFDEIKLNVNEVAKIKIDKPSIDKIREGEILRLYVTGYDKDKSVVPVREIIWTSSHKEVAEVDKNGNVTTKKPGKVTITAQVKDKDIKDSIELKIHEKEFEIEYIGDMEVVNGKQADARVKIKNLTEKTRPATLIVTLYDKKTNRLLNYSILKRDLQSEEVVELATGFLVPNTGDYSIRAFLWEDLENQNIIMQEAKEIKVAN